jgi:hypothetical protein
MNRDEPGATTPETEYRARAARRRESEARWERRHQRIANLRLALFVLFLVLLWLVFGEKRLPAWWLGAPVVVFVALALHHETVLRSRRRMTRAAEYYELGLARLENRWQGRGRSGERLLDPEHPYAADLDLFGMGSLFELLSRARTRAGEERLAGWLQSAASPEEVRERQAAVEDLRPRLDLRETLALLGAEMEVGVHPRELIAWSRTPAALASRWQRGIALVLAVLGVAGAIGWIAWGFGVTPLFLVLFAQILYRMRHRKALLRSTAGIDEAASDLRLLADVLQLAERETFRAARLRAIRARLHAGGRPASRRIQILRILVDCLEARRNNLFAPISFLLLWDFHFAFAVESWRRGAGAAIPDWLGAVAEFEALGSLAGYAYERPLEPFPELVEDGPFLEAEQLGHPLLPDAACVRNDVRLDAGTRLLIVSGSNMSGKSTLLRTVGTAVVLAFAGAPVRARRLRLSRLSLGASMRIQDSILTGVSRFYAEIRRLRTIVALCEGEAPALFLVDEILQGTNSRDRKIGAEAVLRTLLDRGAAGLVTTHDLTLTQIAESLAPRARNVHFEDGLEGGEMFFDYRLRPGVITRSNALALMRAVGLEVGTGGPDRAEGGG